MIPFSEQLTQIRNGDLDEGLSEAFADAHKACHVTDQEFADGVTVGIWIGKCLAHVRIEWQDIEEVEDKE